jgi:hypothetical protein
MNISASEMLTNMIQEKEAEQKAEGILLKAHFLRTYESLKPLNIIKNSIHEIISDPELKTSFVNSAMGYVAGLVAKKAVVGKSYNPLTNIWGSLVGVLVSKMTAKNAEGIKSIGSMLLKKLIHKNEVFEKS